jgi:4'-phosphopantetheinyl transferase
VTSIDWAAPPEHLTLTGSAVHVWRATLSLAEAQVAVLGFLLNAEEQARARRLRFEDKRRSFVAARAILRCILGRYLGLSPQQIQFSYSAQGKPELAPSQATGLRFNLAHSGDLAVVALAYARPIGIDVEHLRPVGAIDQMVDGYFAPAERAAFQRLPPEHRLSAFFAAWTRKEAYLKAQGDGLTLPLDQVVVTLSPDEPPALLADGQRSPDTTPWVLMDLEAAPGYRAALAVRGPVGELAAWQWPASG